SSPQPRGSWTCRSSPSVLRRTRLFPITSRSQRGSSPSLRPTASRSWRSDMAGRQLVFVQQPTRVRIPNAIWPPVRLEVRIGDRVDPSIIDGEVKLSILSGPPGGQIIGTSTARCPNGVATFDDLRFSVPGTYTLIAECDEDKLDLVGLESHSSIVFLDMATVDEQNRLVCQRTGYVLNLYYRNREPPILIDSHLGEGTARRFVWGLTDYWQG